MPYLADTNEEAPRLALTTVSVGVSQKGPEQAQVELVMPLALDHKFVVSKGAYAQILLARADKDYPAAVPPPLRFIRSCSSSLAPATLHKLEAAFKVPVLEVRPQGHCFA